MQRGKLALGSVLVAHGLEHPPEGDELGSLLVDVLAIYFIGNNNNAVPD